MSKYDKKHVRRRQRLWMGSGALVLSAVMALSAVPSFAAWDGFVENAAVQSGAKISLVDFNNAGAILKSGAMPMGKYTKNGNLNSAYWGNQAGTKDVYFSDVPKDWTEYDKIEMEIYSEKATNTEFMFIVETESGEDGSYNYFNLKYKYDWTGWKKFSIPLTSMGANRAADWSKVTRIRFTINGWSLVASDAGIYIASLDLVGGDGTSLTALYSDEKIEQAKEAMEHAVALYGGRSSVLKAGGKVEPISGEGLSSLTEGDTVLAPDVFFSNEFGADIQTDGAAWSMELDGVKLAGKVGDTSYTAGGKQNNFTVSPRSENGHLYLPAAEAAAACGKVTVTDGKLAVIGADDAIKIFERPAGVNELTEIAAYLAGHIKVDPNALTEADCKAVKDNWRYNLVGSEADNDMSDENIAAKVNQISNNGQSAWKSLIKKQGSAELFEGIITTTSNHMTQTYNKLQQMALAYGTSGTKLYKNEELKADILYGLEWMYQHRYGRAEMDGTGWRSTSAFNWWDWKIGSPNALIPIMLIVEDELTAEQKANYLALFDKLVPSTYDVGSNALETGKLAIGSALLQNNPKKVLKVQSALDNLFLYVDNNRNTASQLFGDRCEDRGQGFYTDGSYIYHTLHPMNGTYGMSQFTATGPFLSLFAGTAFEITNPQADNVADWIYNAFEPLIYQGAMFRMVKGRDPNGEHSSGTSAVNGMIAVLDALSPEDQAKVKSIIKKQVLTDTTVNFYTALGLTQVIELTKIMEDDSVQPKETYQINKVYHNEDKVMHQRDDFAMGISMSSSRMFNYECINNQNMTGWYVGDGMIEYHVKGDFAQSNNAYWANINPYRLPGTTVDTQERQAVTIAQGNEYLSSKDFVGGVSDGTYGAAAMWLESYHNDTDYGKNGGDYGGPAPAHDCNLQAKKSYFMFDDEVVCLGTDVNASNGYNVLTVVDNRRSLTTRNLVENASEAEPYEILSAAASETPEAENVAQNTLDGDYSTKWAGQANAALTWDLGEEKELGFILLSFQNGSKRTQKFKIEVSADGKTWTETFQGSSSGKTEMDEAFTLNQQKGRYVRFTNYGNSAGSDWVSLTTAKIYPPNPDGSVKAPEVEIVGADKVVVDGAQKEIFGDDVSLKDAVWAHLDQTGGYYFPQGGDLFARYTKSAQSFFELWLDHGKDPQGGTYAYVMLPGKTAEETGNYAADPDVEILENTPSLQVVREKKLGITAMVFWDAGEYNGIRVDQPMMLMVQDRESGYRISVSDPTRKLSSGKVTLPKAMLAQTQDAKMNITAGSNTQISIDFEGSDGRSMVAELKGGGL